MNIFRFRDRARILDERSQRFLATVAWLGGYVTPEQAQLVGIRNSVPRVHDQLTITGVVNKNGGVPALRAVMVAQPPRAAVAEAPAAA